MDNYSALASTFLFFLITNFSIFGIWENLAVLVDK